MAFPRSHVTIASLPDTRAAFRRLTTAIAPIAYGRALQ